MEYYKELVFFLVLLPVERKLCLYIHHAKRVREVLKNSPKIVRKCLAFFKLTKPSQKAPAFMRGDEWRVLRRVWAEGFPVLPRRKRRDEQLGRTHAALSAGATRQRLDTGASREREFAQRANEDASASEARICMRARARRLAILLVPIDVPFSESVKRWNDSRTPRLSAVGSISSSLSCSQNSEHESPRHECGG